MKPVATSKEEILAVCRGLIHNQKDCALNIRQVAAACGVSVGTVYNYFGSKAELTSAAVESVWCDIFRCEEGQFSSIEKCIQWLFTRLAYGNRQYPGFLTLHSASLLPADKQVGRERMEQAWHHMTTMLCSVVRQDPCVRPDTFDETFTPETFADLLFSLLLAAQLRGTCDPAPVWQLVKRLLY